MASFYADENFHGDVVIELRKLGHDVFTAREAGQADQKISDVKVLAFGSGLGRAVLTHNRRHFVRMHKLSTDHRGIVICTADRDYVGLAQRIHAAVSAEKTLDKKLLRINKPSK